MAAGKKKSAAPKEPRRAVLVMLWRHGLLLAVSRKGKPNDLGFPGGKVKQGESLFDAAFRELHEETGILRREVTDLSQIWESREIENGTPSGRTVSVFYARGEAHTWWAPLVAEPGSRVVWVPPARMVDRRNSFHDFNARLFAALNIDVR